MASERGVQFKLRIEKGVGNELINLISRGTGRNFQWLFGCRYFSFFFGGIDVSF